MTATPKPQILTHYEGEAGATTLTSTLDAFGVYNVTEYALVAENAEGYLYREETTGEIYQVWSGEALAAYFSRKS